MSGWYEFDECRVTTVTGAPQTIPAGVWPVFVGGSVEVSIGDRRCTMYPPEWNKLVLARTARKRP